MGEGIGRGENEHELIKARRRIDTLPLLPFIFLKLLKKMVHNHLVPEGRKEEGGRGREGERGKRGREFHISCVLNLRDSRFMFAAEVVI